MPPASLAAELSIGVEGLPKEFWTRGGAGRVLVPDGIDLEATWAEFLAHLDPSCRCKSTFCM